MSNRLVQVATKQARLEGIQVIPDIFDQMFDDAFGDDCPEEDLDESLEEDLDEYWGDED